MKYIWASSYLNRYVYIILSAYHTRTKNAIKVISYFPHNWTKFKYNYGQYIGKYDEYLKKSEIRNSLV